MLRVALDFAGIPFYVHNESFGGLFPGMQLALWNERAIRVPPACVEDAVAVIRQVRESYRPGFSDLTVRSKVRILFEAFLFAWPVPAGEQKPAGDGPATTDPGEGTGEGER